MSDGDAALAGAALVQIDPKERARVQLVIREAFDLFDKEGKGTVLQDEVPTIIRYLDPAEKDIIRNIIPDMQEEEPVGYVTFERFERKMLDILLPSNDYLPDDDDALRQCFLALDKERVGYVTAETMSMLLTTKGTPMRPKELEAFLKAAKCPDTGRIYYDDYIALMTKDIGFA